MLGANISRIKSHMLSSLLLVGFSDVCGSNVFGSYGSFELPRKVSCELLNLSSSQLTLNAVVLSSETLPKV